MNISYERLNSSNFTGNSLDGFIRHQAVKESWRNISGEWRLVPTEFEENWSLEECREIACDIARHMEKDQSAFGAFCENELVGFITVSHELFGESAKYAELVCFQVSEPYRRRGIGRELFRLAVNEMDTIGAAKLYISSQSSKETQAAYRTLGCVHAREINREIADGEPFDVQLEYSKDG